MKAKASTTRAAETRPSIKFLDASPRGVLAGSALNVVRAIASRLRAQGKGRQLALPSPAELNPDLESP